MIAAGQGMLSLLCLLTSVVRPCWKSILSLLALLPQIHFDPRMHPGNHKFLFSGWLICS